MSLPKLQWQDGTLTNLKHFAESVIEKFNAVVTELDDLKKRIAAFESPPVIVTGNLSEDAKAEIRKQWAESYSGPNPPKLMVLPRGCEVALGPKAVELPSSDPQVIGNFVVDQLQGTAALSTVSMSENKEDAVDTVPSKPRGKK